MARVKGYWSSPSSQSRWPGNLKKFTRAEPMGVGGMARAADAPVMERMLLHQIECAADYNTWWYLQEWARGRDPSCCASCAGLRYRSKWESQIDTIPALLHKGTCSCGPAVAMSVGNHRAKMLVDMYGEEAPQHIGDEETLDAYYPEMLSEGKRLWHCVLVTPDGAEDVTEKLKRG